LARSDGRTFRRRVEYAALEKWRAQRSEIPRRHLAGVGDDDRLPRLRLVPLGHDVVLRIATRQGNPLGHPGRTNARNRRDTFQYPVVEAPHHGRAVVARVGNLESRHQRVVGTEPGVDRQQSLEALDEETRTSQQDER
jgi:hypothetical protein